MHYSKTFAGQPGTGEVRFSFTPTRPDLQAAVGRQGENGPLYVLARVRPDLKVQLTSVTDQWAGASRRWSGGAQP